MKITSLFRTLTPLVMEPFEGKSKKIIFSTFRDLESKFDPIEAHAEFLASDPEGGVESTIGLSPIEENVYFRDIDGSGVLFFIEIAKRNLPARVIRDVAERKRHEVERETGRKVGRKEFREMLEDAKFELLPRAFASRIRIPVIVTRDNRLFIFTGTGKTIDAITSFLFEFARCFGLEFMLGHPETKVSLESWMTGMAAYNFEGEELDIKVTPTDFAVMRGEESEQIRIVNRSLDFQAVRDTLKAGYRVRQIGLYHIESQISFRLSDSLTLRAIDFSDDAKLELTANSSDEALGDLHALTWLVITEYRKLLDDLISDINSTVTDEDEL
jgi:recombination associated protein RdgC